MMKKLLNFFIAIALFTNYASAQNPNYLFEAVSGTYTPITGTAVSYFYHDGTANTANADDGYANIPIGFTFNYNGTNYTTLNVSANGWVSFGAPIPNASNTWGNNLSTALTATRPILAPLWDDMDNTPGGTLYNVSGTAPNRVFTLQWANQRWEWSATAAVMSVQLKLYETSNIIEFIYRQEAGAIVPTSLGASIGITATATGANTFISLTNASSNPGISYTTSTNTILTKPATGQIYRFIPSPTYCTTSTNSHPTGTEAIQRVEFGTINNRSDSPYVAPSAQYENFTYLSTNLLPGATPFKVTGVNTYDRDQLLIWIDFNHNGLFTDPGEAVYASPAGPTTGSEGPYIGNITVPATALTGPTRMRVKLIDQDGTPPNPTPCGLSDWGQVEDYTVTILACPVGSITTQPAATTTICANGSGTISVVTTGTAAFQWQVSTDGGTTWTNLTNTAPYSGVLTNTLTITNPALTTNSYRYRAVINGGCITSSSSTLTTNAFPTITLANTPGSLTRLFPGLTTSLTATGGAGTYKWFLNGVEIPGATTGTLSNITVDRQGSYRAQVTNAAGCTSPLSNTFFIGDSTNTNLFISPSPTTGQFKVRLFSAINNTLTRTVNIYDTKGARVYTRYYTLSVPYQSMDVDLSHFMPGLYFVEVGDASGQRLKVGTVVKL